ncbi:MAG TPA: hypothetical protein VLF14_07895 [Candidatus Binatia bacterium]|nr:hypothetical protein [Candidatus Binatia bacterium]
MKTRSTIAAAIGALLLSACDDGDGGGSSSPTPAATPPATATAEPTSTSGPPTPTRTATPTPTIGGQLDIAICAPEAAPFSAEIDNPFFPLPVGTQWVLTGEEDGAAVRLVISSLPDTEVVAGVTTRVVEERESEDGELVEVSRNFFAQSADGTVCYYGEDVDDYEDGEIVGHGGAWRAGVSGALPGILIPANPQVGQTFQQESAPGVAEDHAEQVAAGESVTVGLGTFSDTIRYEESSPLDRGTSDKVYARGVGLLVDDALERVAAKELARRVDLSPIRARFP